MRRLSYVFAGLAAAGAGTYLVVYLYRWQWQRAVLSGVLLLVVEVLLLGLVLMGRMTRIEQRVRDSDRRQQDVLARLREPPEPELSGRFRWLEERGDGTYVFVPVLMVTGVLLSGLAWVVQRVASATARPAAERRLAGRLAVLAAPDPTASRDPLDPYADDDPYAEDPYNAHGPYGSYGKADPASYPDIPSPAATPLDDLPPAVPHRSPARTARTVTVGVLGAALLAALVVGLADLTQTREERADGSVATSVLLKVDMRGAGGTAERRSLAARQVWESCRDSTSVPLRNATLGDLHDGTFAGVVRPALTPHDRMRLRGCLEDATLQRTHLTVMGIGNTGGN
ncbi:hypothetical protein ACIQAC_00600 [Streptomyces sp. NPDC088387]|uniref:hypothetical protein n=1 Tax=Streptomyces sp. NPDC088387 TaxID=3365859 RepID=UPI00382EA3EB